MERPQKPYFDLFDEKGVAYEQKDGVLTVQGTLTPGRYELPGDVSSQFVTGLLYALPLLDGPSRIVLTTRLESRGYVDMTLEVLNAFGIPAGCMTEASPERGPELWVPGGYPYLPHPMDVEADWSQAGFWYAAMALDNPVDITGLNPQSTQGDKVIDGHFVDLGRPGDVEIDVSGCPDLVPPLAVMAAVRSGTTRLVNAARLRIKESDRLAAVTEVLNALGADVEEHPDSLTIRGRDGLAGGVTVSAHNDHRIAMMTAIAATRCAAPVTLTGAESVAKSYPNFWEDYESLGGQIEEVNG